jgi:hypothetical protein
MHSGAHSRRRNAFFRSKCMLARISATDVIHIAMLIRRARRDAVQGAHAWPAQTLGTRVQLAGRRAHDASRDQSLRTLLRLVREWHHVTHATRDSFMTTFTEVIEGSHATHVARFGVVAQR